MEQECWCEKPTTKRKIKRATDKTLLVQLGRRPKVYDLNMAPGVDQDVVWLQITTNRERKKEDREEREEKEKEKEKEKEERKDVGWWVKPA